MKASSSFLAGLLAVAGLPACSTSEKVAVETGDATRAMRFEYQATFSSFPANSKVARIWLPLPQTVPGVQRVSNLRVKGPVPYREGRDATYGNRMAYFEVAEPTGSVEISLTFDVERTEVRAMREQVSGGLRRRFLDEDRLVPQIEPVRAKVLEVKLGEPTVPGQARAIYNRVLADVDYDKSGEGWGRGDIKYVCAVGKGNCSDFHSLFTAMSRAAGIPAYFEIGFPIPADKSQGTVGGYHCWAWYGDGNLWRPVDISEADKAPEKTDYFFGTICENRISFSRGRDIVLEPPQDGEPINFFVYPHVEVDGNADAARTETTFSFKNL